METGMALIGLATLIIAWNIKDIIKLWKDCNSNPNKTKQSRDDKDRNKETEG